MQGAHLERGWKVKENYSRDEYSGTKSIFGSVHSLVGWKLGKPASVQRFLTVWNERAIAKMQLCRWRDGLGKNGVTCSRVCCVCLCGFKSYAPFFLLMVLITVHQDYTNVFVESIEGTWLSFLFEILQIQLMATMYLILLNLYYYTLFVDAYRNVLAGALVYLCLSCPGHIKLPQLLSWDTCIPHFNWNI